MNPLIYHYWLIANDDQNIYWDIVSFKVVEVNDYLHSICAKLDDPLSEIEFTYGVPVELLCPGDTTKIVRKSSLFFP